MKVLQPIPAYSSPNFEGHLARSNTERFEALGPMHAYRPSAGLFERTAVELTKLGEIDAPDIERLIAAARAEVEGTGHGIGLFEQDFLQFNAEWGWAFTTAARAALGKVSSLVLDSPKLGDSSEPKICNPAQVNALFYQVAADAVVTADEVDELLLHGEALNHFPKGAFDQNLTRLYADPSLERKLGMGAVDLRARAKDPMFAHRLEIGRAAEAIMASPDRTTKGSIDTLQKLLREGESDSQPRNRNQLKKALENALVLRGLGLPEFEASLPEEALTCYDDLLDGKAQLDRLLEALTDAATIDTDTIRRTHDAYTWHFEANGNPATFGALINETLQHHYAEDPRVTDDAVAFLDTLIISPQAAELRPKIRGLDFISLLQFATAHNVGHAEATYGDLDEGDFVRLEFDGGTLSVTDYGEPFPGQEDLLATHRTPCNILTFSSAPLELYTSSAGSGTDEDISAFLSNPHFTEAFRHLIHVAGF